MRHLYEADATDLLAKFKTESESIDSHDLFGILLDDQHSIYDQTGRQNPFAMFLEEFANETGGTAELDEYPAHPILCARKTISSSKQCSKVSLLGFAAWWVRDWSLHMGE
jgi:hypothetical protein